MTSATSTLSLIMEALNTMAMELQDSVMTSNMTSGTENSETLHRSLLERIPQAAGYTHNLDVLGLTLR